MKNDSILNWCFWFVLWILLYSTAFYVLIVFLREDTPSSLYGIYNDGRVAGPIASLMQALTGLAAWYVAVFSVVSSAIVLMLQALSPKHRVIISSALAALGAFLCLLRLIS